MGYRVIRGAAALIAGDAARLAREWDAVEHGVGGSGGGKKVMEKSRCNFYWLLMNPPLFYLPLQVLFILLLLIVAPSSPLSSPDTFGNGPAPCQGASFHPAVRLASCESEEGRGQVVEPTHPRLACSQVTF